MSFAMTGQAQTGFYSTVSAKKIIIGTTLEYSIVAENIKSVRDIEAPNFGGLKVISGPMSSTSTSFINGVTSSKQERIYTLSATKPGTYTIGSASANIKGKKSYTKKIKIEVVANKSKTKGENKEEKFFVKMIPSDTIVYIGQQLIIDYVLYTQVSVQAANMLQESGYDGFYKEDNNRFSRSNSIKEVNGIQYQTSRIRQVSLYPQQTGTYNIEEAIFKIGIATNNNRQSRSIFFRNTLNYHNVITNNIKIRVREVPTPPLDYIGGVGDFKLQAKLDRQTVQNNKALNLYLIIEGNGDPKMFTPPILNLGENLEVYEPILKEERDQEMANTRYFSKKYQYTIVPKKEGRYNINVKCSYYNSDSSRYERLSKGPFSLQVQKGRIAEKIVDNIIKKELRQNWDIAEIKPSTSMLSLNLLNGFILLSFIGLLGMIGTKVYQIKTSDERQENKRQKELKDRVLSRLKEANKYKEENNSRAFHDEIFKAIQKYLSDKFGMTTGNITTQKITDTLQKEQINQSVIDEINSLLNDSQMALFGGVNNRSMQETYDSLTRIIENLES